MRILLFIQPNSAHSLKFVEQCLHNGFTTGLVTTNEDKNNYPDNVTIFHMERSYPSFIKGFGWVRMWLASRGIVKEFQPDIVHGHYISEGGVRAYLSGGRPLALTPWGSDLLLEIETANFLQQKIMIRALKAATFITFNSLKIKKECLKWSEHADMLEYRFGVSKEIFHPEDGDHRLRDYYDIPKDSFVILSPRNAKKIYNLEACLNLMARLNGNEILIVKYFAADIQYLNQLEELSLRLGITDKVRWVGAINQEEMGELYRISNVVISAAKSDSFPITFFEAWASGRPLVCSALSTYTYLVNENNAIMVDWSDLEGVVKTIHEIQSSSALYNRLVDHGRRTFRLYGDESKEFKRVADKYRKVQGDQ